MLNTLVLFGQQVDIFQLESEERMLFEFTDNSSDKQTNFRWLLQVKC